MRKRLAFVAVFILICLASSVAAVAMSCQQTNTTTINTTASMDDFVEDSFSEDAFVQSAEADTNDAIGMWGSSRLNIANFRYNCQESNCDLTQATIETIPAPWLSCSFFDGEVPHIQYTFDLDTNTVLVSTESFEGAAPDREWADHGTDIDTILDTAKQQVDSDDYGLHLTWIGEWTGQVILAEGTSERLDFE
jgi:hypothetical protein